MRIEIENNSSRLVFIFSQVQFWFFTCICTLSLLQNPRLENSNLGYFTRHKFIHLLLTVILLCLFLGVFKILFHVE